MSERERGNLQKKLVTVAASCREHLFWYQWGRVCIKGFYLIRELASGDILERMFWQRVEKHCRGRWSTGLDGGSGEVRGSGAAGMLSPPPECKERPAQEVALGVTGSWPHSRR